MYVSIQLVNLGYNYYCHYSNIKKTKNSTLENKSRIKKLERTVDYYKNESVSESKSKKIQQTEQSFSEEDKLADKWACSCGHINDSFCVRCTSCLQERPS